MSAEQLWRVVETTAVISWAASPYFVALAVFAAGYIGLFKLGAWAGNKFPRTIARLTHALPPSAARIALVISVIVAVGIVALWSVGAHHVAAASIAEIFGLALGAGPAALLGLLLVVGALSFASGLVAGAVLVYARNRIAMSERSDKS